MSNTEAIASRHTGEPTRSYDADRPRTAPRLAAGSGTEPSQELQALLRRRLTLLARIYLCTGVLFLGILAPFLVHEKNREVLAQMYVLVVLPVVGMVLIRRRAVYSLRVLRLMELVTLGVLVSVLLWS